MADLTNYPDLLGGITKGARANLGLIQVASALRPRVIMAGRPLEMLLLLQNASNTEVAVQATLKLPAQDANRQKGRFISRAETLSVKLGPAMVGLLTLPLTTLPDTAIGAGYRVGMEVRVGNPGGKPTRIRQASGGDVDVELLSDDKRELVATLQKLPWTASLSGATLDNTLTIMSGKVGVFADLQPTFTTLWTPADYGDDTYLLHTFASALYQQILPVLKRGAILPVMQQYTAKRFSQVGYPLQPAEMDGIARLLTLQLEMTTVGEKETLLSEESARHSLLRYFRDDGKLNDDLGDVRLPHWVKEFAQAVAQDERVLQFPVKAIAHFAYDGLLRDAMLEGFVLAERSSGDSLGTLAEQEQYIDGVFASLEARTLTFDQLYLPLMMGVISAAPAVTVRNERSIDLVRDLRKVLENRVIERNPATEQVYSMAENLTKDVAFRYGTA